jgi:hypothetical protein
MAQLQGYFLLYKDNMTDAIKDAHTLRSSDMTNHNILEVPSKDNSSCNSVDLADDDITTGQEKRKVMAKRQLSASELDRMVFNPQPGWDTNIKEI